MRNIKNTHFEKKSYIKKINNFFDYTFENTYFLIKFLPFFLIILLLIVGFFYTYKNRLLLKKYEDLGKITQQVLKYDLISENSITKYVWKWVGLNENFLPKTQIFESKNIIWKAILTPQAWENFLALASWFYEEFWTKIKVVSSYRSYQYQHNLIKKYPNSVEEGFRAKPWESEHQLWLAIDIFEATSVENFFENKNLFQYRAWLQNNAHKYWFTQSYKFWVEIDWYNIEPWHRRYVWTGLASELYKKNTSFSQYYTIFY